MSELHLVTRCEHETLEPHCRSIHPHFTDVPCDTCPGGSVVVLDPEKALQGLWVTGSPMVPYRFARVFDVIRALRKGGTDG